MDRESHFSTRRLRQVGAEVIYIFGFTGIRSGDLPDAHFFLGRGGGASVQFLGHSF